MKCNGVSFAYRGFNPHGDRLAELLSEITVRYDTVPGGGSFDLGSLLHKAVGTVDAPQAPQTKQNYSIPVIEPFNLYVSNPVVRQWLQSMGIETGKPVLVQFEFEDKQ